MLTIDEFVFADAVQFFWEDRQRAGSRQEEGGSRDQGFRSQVTSGKHMAGFLHTITELIRRAGVDVGLIHPRAVTIPGFYRPTKDWDLLVVGRGRLEAVLELKAQVGPSFGNNFNNRTEEAIGSAVDLWTAFREGAFGTHRPWLGYLFVLEDCPRSRAAVRVHEPHFGVFEEFRTASYARRYELLCRKLVLEGKYDSACFLMASREDAVRRPNYTEPDPGLGAKQFVSSLLGRLAPPVQ